MNAQEIKPSAGFYGLAAGVFVLGAGVALYLMISYFVSMGEDMIAVEVPGEQELQLKEAGDYTIFHEYRGRKEGRVYSQPQGLQGMQFTLKSKDTGTPIALTNPAGNMTYTIGSRSGVAILEFTIDQPGTYVLEAQYAQDHPGQEGVVTVSPAFMQRMILLIFGSIALGGGSFVLAVIIFLVTLTKRNRYKRMLRS